MAFARNSMCLAVLAFLGGLSLFLAAKKTRAIGGLRIIHGEKTHWF